MNSFPAGPRAAALAVLVLLTALLPFRHVLPLGSFDQPFYLGIAQDLITEGSFTNGYRFDPPQANGARPPGMRFAPLYPALLAAAAEIDPSMRTGMACLVASENHDPTCSSDAPIARTGQFAALAVVFWLIWWMGWRLAGGARGAWLALLVAVPVAPALLAFAGTLMTETVTLLFTTAATCCAIEAVWGRRSAAWCAASGALLALAALTRPAFFYLVPVAMLGLAAVRWHGRRRVGPACAFATAALLLLLPWLIRNELVLGRFALSFGYDSHTLVQRIAFDTMTWREYGLSWLCFLPDGNAIGQALAGPGACARFGWDDRPDSFYSIGLREMLPQTLAAAGGYSHHLRYLLTHYVLRTPLWHAAISLPLALRGACLQHWWGFLLLPPSLFASWRALCRTEAGFLVLALPAWFMLAFNASVAVNQPRYNFMLAPLYAVAGARILYRGRWNRKARPVPTRPAAPPPTDGPAAPHSAPMAL